MGKASTVLVAVAVIAMSGCADAGEPASISTSTSVVAPQPTADVETGAVDGLVFDEEQLPVAGATVALVETGAETKTDAAGKFSFSQLEPKKYRLIAQRLGYESAGLAIDVVAGEIVPAKITLKSLNLDLEPYHSSQPRVALIHASVVLVQNYVNESAANSITCDPCRFPIHFDKNPHNILSEGTWVKSGNPVVNAGLNIWFYKDWSGSSLGTNICYMQPNNPPYRVLWSETCTKNAAKLDKFLMTVHPGPVPGILSIEHKVETWTTFGYNADLPENFTALPPS